MSRQRVRPRRVVLRHAHRMVLDVARGLAAELYEMVMSNNEIRSRWKEQNPGASEQELIRRFVMRNMGKCLDSARASLVGLLQSDTISETHKAEIIDALAKDSMLLRGRVDTALAPRALKTTLASLVKIKGLPTCGPAR